jgi:peptidyl-prolyl cis-trans isomerase C
MNFKFVFQAIVITIVVAGCGKGGEVDSPAPSATPPGVATVNAETITAPMLDVFARGRGMDPADPAARQAALDALIENVLLAQEAEARGLTARPEVQAELALVKLQQLAGRTLADMRGSAPVSDAEVQAYYERERERTGNIELHIKHMLFADEAAAAAMIERALPPGADFDALMVDAPSQGARQARDLGWANLAQLPPELAQAANALPDGQVGPLPVQTSFGWHVFKREASRPFSPPPLEQVAEGARRQLVDKYLGEQIQALRTRAKIVIGTAPGG